MRQLVDSQATAGSASAFGFIEHEERRPDAAVNEVVRPATQSPVESLGLRLARTLFDLDLNQSIADEKRGGDSGLDRLLVLEADHETIHDGVDMAHLRFIHLEVFGKIHRLAVDDEPPATFFANLGEDKVQLLAIHLEQRRTQLNL